VVLGNAEMVFAREAPQKEEVSMADRNDQQDPSAHGRNTRHHQQEPEHCGNAGAACPAVSPAGQRHDQEFAREHPKTTSAGPGTGREDRK